jgi:hypothetical protein
MGLNISARIAPAVIVTWRELERKMIDTSGCYWQDGKIFRIDISCYPFGSIGKKRELFEFIDNDGIKKMLAAEHFPDDACAKAQNVIQEITPRFDEANEPRRPIAQERIFPGVYIYAGYVEDHGHPCCLELRVYAELSAELLSQQWREKLCWLKNYSSFSENRQEEQRVFFIFSCNFQY